MCYALAINYVVHNIIIICVYVVNIILLLIVLHSSVKCSCVACVVRKTQENDYADVQWIDPWVVLPWKVGWHCWWG